MDSDEESDREERPKRGSKLQPSGFKYFFSTSWPLLTALLITISFGCWIAYLANQTVGNGNETRWQKFLTAEPNAMGDTLAGVVGSLTLIWVVASVIQQSMELRAQRREFFSMVQAQQEQADELRKQSSFSDSELEHRRYSKAYSLVNQKVIALSEALNEIKVLYSWRAENGEHYKATLFSDVEFQTDKPKRERNFSMLGDVFQKMMQGIERVDEGLSTGKCSVPSCDLDAIENAISLSEELMSLRERLSDHSKLRFDRMHLDEGVSALNALKRSALVWGGKAP